jgi:hypothetical protein
MSPEKLPVQSSRTYFPGCKSPMAPSRKLKLHRRFEGILNFRPLYFCRCSSSDLPKLVVGLDAWGQVQRGLAHAGVVGVARRGEIVAGVERNSTNHASSG